MKLNENLIIRLLPVGLGNHLLFINIVVIVLQISAFQINVSRETEDKNSKNKS